MVGERGDVRGAEVICERAGKSIYEITGKISCTRAYENVCEIPCEKYSKRLQIGLR